MSAGRRSATVGVWLAGLLLLVGGCARQPAVAYVARVDTDRELAEEVAPRHQQQIAAYLHYLYGTPNDPRLRTPVPPAEDDSPDEGPATTDEDADSPTEASPGDQPLPAIKMSVADQIDRQRLRLGRQVYVQQCAVCHGHSGDGRGIAMVGEDGEGHYLNPPPRDYRGSVKTERATYKFTSTPLGYKPRRDDLRRILRYGAKGTSMPSFRWMPEEELEAVIDYVQLLSHRGELEIKLLSFARYELSPEDDLDDETVAAFAQQVAESWHIPADEVVQPLTRMPLRTAETVNAGALAFAELNCVKCHNRDARGSKTADVGFDDWGQIAYPADLTMGTLHGGRRPIDIYRRIYTGINGTPMPGSAEPDSSKNETHEERSERIWHLVHFITQVIESNEVPPAQQQIIDEAMARIRAELDVPATDE